ncbi:MAG: IclR family transcriptional regulator [Anaerolineales bacterium]|nr:IclR family transcriptional regulator [Anaerolineales bacterium]
MKKSESGSLSRALQILDAFSAERSEFGVRELARYLDLPVSTSGRTLALLKEAGVLIQDPNTKSYSMGYRVLQWAYAVRSSLRISDLAFPIMQRLNKTTRETVTLSVIQETHSIVIERIQSPQMVQYSVHPGDQIPLYCGAAGKLYLADQDPAELEQILDGMELVAHTSETITARPLLYKELDTIRQNGYAISRGEYIDGAGVIAALVRGPNGQIMCTLSLCMPLQRFNKENENRYIDLVLTASQDLSNLLGGRFSS